MAKINKTPRLSANKLGEYMMSKAARQHQILRTQKYPPEYITTYYRDAQESISLFMASNMENIKILEQKLQILEQQNPENVREIQRITGNIAAIEQFMNLIDEIDFKGARPELGNPQPQKLKIMNVEISARPDILLKTQGVKGKTILGAIKLHFPKGHPLGEDASGYISTLMQMYLEQAHQAEGVPSPKHCLTIDIGVGKVHHGVTAITQRKKDIEAACQQIHSLWPTIEP